MSRNGKVIVAMSGGVDSSVAACLLAAQGYECIGVFLRVGVEHEPAAHDELLRETATCCTGSSSAAPTGARAAGLRLRHGCCSTDDAVDARAVAARLGIPFYVLNFRDDFERIVEYFIDEYAVGRTPNPCVQCNMRLKFGKLLRYADMVDAEFVATGHYARILDRRHGPRLARSLNRAKDQSYVLFGIGRDDLRRCQFPVGEVADKAEVRRIAAALGLRVHDKPDSQEICFVPNNDYRGLLRQRRPELLRPGNLCDTAGRRIGVHAGVAAYTIGQRRGLGVALGRPAYVTRLDVINNVVTLGTKDDLLSDGLDADDVNWLVDVPSPDAERIVQIKIRHLHTPAGGRIRVLPDGAVSVRFDQPQLAVTPGQAAVFYEDDIVLGGGWIRDSLPPASA